MHENREISSTPWSHGQGRSAKAESRTADMHVLEKSDCAVVPVNQPNKEGQPSAEAGEGRAQTRENIVQSHMHPTQSGKRMSQGLDGVRKAARERKQERFTALLHHLNVDLLRDSFYALQRKASPGVDGVTWQEYETGLEDRLVDLHSRVHRGTYRAKPSRRVFIPKADGRQRPLGIAALEDKIVQQAVVTILNQIYEVDFKGFSYGFRPGRSPHQALDALTVGIQRKRVNWVLDADIRGFFDNLSHEWTMKFIEHRVADRRILRLIRKWLKAGVSEDGQWSETKLGTPQGAVASPLIANVYLHYLFDLWADVWRRKVAKGDVVVVRYADDLVMGFQHRTEAERFLKEFRERLAKFGLELHPDKTRLIEFGRFAARDRKQRGERKPETFTFLGFTHYCGQRHIVVDTGNYYPQQRDGRIDGIEAGATESRWVAQQLGRPVVKAFNNIYAQHLMDLGRPAGAPGRIALPIAGDVEAAKAVVLRLLDELGFDGVDAGGLDESWRQQPGSPVYATDFDVAGVKRALSEATKERKPEWRATANSPGDFAKPA